MNTTPASAGFSLECLSRLTSFLQGYVDRGELPGMIATIARQSQTVYYEKFGWMDCEARKPICDDAIFRIASMTKPITSVGIMMLYEERHFDLDTPIAKFIPAFRDTEVFVKETESGLKLAPLQHNITFRHLFTHTSGLSYGENPQDPVDRQYQRVNRRMAESNIPMTNERLVDALVGLPLAFQPGTQWRYSLSIDVLGYLIEVISGMSLDVFLEERLFKPLGMVDTRFYTPPEQAGRLVTLYGPSESGLRRIDQLQPPFQAPFEPPTWVSGGGGVASTVHDYARFAQMLTNGGELDGVRLLSSKTVGLYSLNQAPEQALSYFHDDPYNQTYGYSLGTRVLMDTTQPETAGSVGEFGWDGAFSTYFWVDPKESLYGLLMLQYSPKDYRLIHEFHQQFKQLTYQALVA